jgi:hypothetical protein
MSADNLLNPAQRDDLRVLAGVMIPASAEVDVPGADDAIIQARPTSSRLLARTRTLCARRWTRL